MRKWELSYEFRKRICGIWIYIWRPWGDIKYLVPLPPCLPYQRSLPFVKGCCSKFLFVNWVPILFSFCLGSKTKFALYSLSASSEARWMWLCRELICGVGVTLSWWCHTTAGDTISLGSPLAGDDTPRLPNLSKGIKCHHSHPLVFHVWCVW